MHVTHADPVARDALARVHDQLGHGSVLVRPRTTYEGLDRVVQHVRSRARGGLLVTDLAGQEEELEATGDLDLVAFHTSGSTGSPTCVVYRADVVRGHAAMVAGSLGLDPSRRYVALPPCHFAYGLSIVTSHEQAGAPVTFVPVAGTTEGVGAALREVAPDTVYLLPQQLTHLLARAQDAGTVHTVVVAGGRLSQAGAGALLERLGDVELVNMYGQAELGPRLATWRGPVSTFVEGTIGEPVPGVELTLAEPDASGRTELLARSRYAVDHLLAAPYDVPRALPADRPHATGDLVTRGPLGLVHQGRASRFANVAGTKIDLDALEAHLRRTVPATATRVGTRPARALGDDVLVVQVVPGEDSLTAGDVRRAMHEVLGSLVALTEVGVVEHLEVGEAGK